MTAHTAPEAPRAGSGSSYGSGSASASGSGFDFGLRAWHGAHQTTRRVQQFLELSWRLSLGLCLSLLSAHSTHAQNNADTFPAKPIKVMVGYGPGARGLP